MRDLPTLPLADWEATNWGELNGGALALLGYEAVRTAPDPRAALMAFLESAYQAGALESGGDRRDLASSWCPSPLELSDLLGRVGTA